MRNIKRFLRPAVRLLCFALVFCLLCGLCNYYLARPEDFEPVMAGFYGLEPNSVTTLFIGTSMAFDAYYADAFDEIAGGYSYGIASDGQSPASSYYLLREAFQTQRPQTVVIDANWCIMTTLVDGYLPPTNAMSALLIADHMRWNANKLAYVANVIPSENWIDVLFPFFRYRERYCLAYMRKNANQRVTMATTQYTDRGFEHRAGGYAEDAVGPMETYPWGGENAERLAWLTRINQLCKQNGARLMILTPPLSYPALAAVPNYQDYLDSMARFAEEQDVLWMDFSLLRADKLDRVNAGYYAIDRAGSHLSGTAVALPYTRLAAEVVVKDREGALDKSDYLYGSYDELMASVDFVCAAWATYDPATRTAAFAFLAPSHVAVEYRFAVKTEQADSYPAFSEYGAASADLSALTAGTYTLRVEARAVGSASEYEQCYELAIRIE